MGAKISCYFITGHPDVAGALIEAKQVLESYRHITGQGVTLDEEVGMEPVGGNAEHATYFCKLVCDGLVDLGELVPLGFDFELID